MLKFKKAISILLCAAMSLSLFTASVSAEESTSEAVSIREGVIEAFHLIEPVKENYGFTDEDLTSMELAAPINTYECTSEGVSFLRRYVPLLCDNILKAWAIEAVDDNNVFYQISTAYIDEINSATDNTTAFALIYDRESCYMFDGSDMRKLGSYEEIGGRSVLTNDVLETADIELNSICEACELRYTNRSTVYGAVPPETTYKCDVSYITQNGYSSKYLCWAATIACIVNYVYDINLTAYDVYTYTKVVNSSLIDNNGSVSDNNITEVLQLNGLYYQYKAYVPAISNIETNIKNGYPIFGIFTYYDKGVLTGHACAIYGCTKSNVSDYGHCIYVMDPAYDFATAQYNSGTYKFVSGSSGITISLTNVVSEY